MTPKVEIAPAVALVELTARADAERSFYQSRCLLLAQEGHVLRQTIAAQKAEIERLTKRIPPTQSAPTETPSPKPKTPAGAAAKAE